MSATLAGIWRHPVKAVGRERLGEAQMTAGATLPGDRIWAIAHEKARIEDASGAWAGCVNFIRAAGSPDLMAVTARLALDGQSVQFAHPDRPDLEVAPDQEPEALIDWVRPLVAPDRPAPAAVHRAATRGFTDNSEPTVTLCNAASHRAVEHCAGVELSTARWRGNLWIEGADAWAERDWIGREIRIGDALFRVLEDTGRCRATEANPETGARDIDMLSLLSSNFGHRDFGVQAVCIGGGRIAEGAAVEVLA